MDLLISYFTFCPCENQKTQFKTIGSVMELNFLAVISITRNFFAQFSALFQSVTECQYTKKKLSALTSKTARVTFGPVNRNLS